MRPLQLPAPVEAERGLQGSGLALVEDRECVDHHAPFEREVACRPAELREQQREVEAGDTEPREVAAVQVRGQPRRQRLEPRLPCDVLVTDAVHGRGCWRDGDAGIDERGVGCELPAGQELEHGHLDDAVLLRAEACGLEIHEDERSPQREPGGQPVGARGERLGVAAHHIRSFRFGRVPRRRFRFRYGRYAGQE